MITLYPLEWIDALILNTLNPNKTDISGLSKHDESKIKSMLVVESQKIQIQLKKEIFTIQSRRQIRLQVRKYHSSLVYLLDQVIEFQKRSKAQKSIVYQCISKNVISVLDELLAVVENRYSHYLSLDERVPITYLMVSGSELELKLKNLQQQRFRVQEIQQVLNVVVEELSKSLSMQGRSKVTFRQVLYERMVLKALEQVSDGDTEGDDFFSVLDRRLIGLNFNSSQYIDVLLKRITVKIQELDDPMQKLHLLSYYFKQLNQINSNEKLFFNPGLSPLKIILGNWFTHELAYVDRQVELEAGTAGRIVSPTDKPESKLECDLSADQIGIILRAADEARVVKSRSMSLVFQRIVPHLSTAFKRDLSYQSVRSKSYNAEENDKNIAILTLEKMIKKIRSY